MIEAFRLLFVGLAGLNLLVALFSGLYWLNHRQKTLIPFYAFSLFLYSILFFVILVIPPQSGMLLAGWFLAAYGLLALSLVILVIMLILRIGKTE